MWSGSDATSVLQVGGSDTASYISQQSFNICYFPYKLEEAQVSRVELGRRLALPSRWMLVVSVS